jgi:putative hemolysin
VQIGITVVSTTAGAFGGAAVASRLEPLVRLHPVIGPYAHDVALVAVVAMISYLSLVLGELVPKSLAMRAAEPYALWVSHILTGLAWIARPLVWLLTASSNLILRPFADKTNFMEAQISRQELQDMVDEAAKTGEMSEQTSELTSRALQFEELTGADVMVARNDIVALPRNADTATIRRCLLEERRSRIPVHDGSLDNVVGYVTAKDLLPLAWENKLFVLADVLRPVRVFIETTPASQLLEFMQHERQRLAILVDEHGATAGLVTFEDLVEELVGDIFSEHEEATPLVERQPDGSAIVRGDAPVREVNRELGLELVEAEGATTIAGLCGKLGGGIPNRNARLAAEDGTVIVVLEASTRAVKRVRIIPPPRPVAESPAAAHPP